MDKSGINEKKGIWVWFADDWVKTMDKKNTGSDKHGRSWGRLAPEKDRQFRFIAPEPSHSETIVHEPETGTRCLHSQNVLPRI